VNSIYKSSFLFSFDRVTASSVFVSRHVFSGSSLVSCSGCSGLGTACLSQAARLGLSAFEYSNWKSDSSLVGKFSRGAAGGTFQMVVTSGLQYSLIKNPGSGNSLQGSTLIGTCSKLSLHVHVPPPNAYSDIKDIVSLGKWRIVSIPSTISPDVSTKITAVWQYRLSQVTTSGFVFLANSWSGFGLPGNFPPPGAYVLEHIISTWNEGYVTGYASIVIAVNDIPISIAAIHYSVPVSPKRTNEFFPLLDMSSCFESESKPPVQFAWQILNCDSVVIINSTFKWLVVPPFFFGNEANDSYTVSLTINGAVRFSSTFTLYKEPPIAVIDAGQVAFVGSAGTLLSAADSYDPNFSEENQPSLNFSWNCDGMERNQTWNSKYLNLRWEFILLHGSICSVTVASGSTNSTATVVIYPVAGVPPQLSIRSSSSLISADQRFVISVRLRNEPDQLYQYQWFSKPKGLEKHDIFSTDKRSSLVVKAGYFNLNFSEAVFVCRVTNMISNTSANASIVVKLNEAPNCRDLYTWVYVEHCGEVGPACKIDPMRTKTRIELHDSSGTSSLCKDNETPITYRLLAFSADCETEPHGQFLAASSQSIFNNIVLGIAVHTVAIEAVDALGAKTRVCSTRFEHSNTLSVATFTSLMLSRKKSLVTASETGLLFASNCVASLSTFGANAGDLEVIKDYICDFLSALGTEVQTNPTGVYQLSYTLHTLSTLPGQLSSASSLKSAAMFERVAESCLDMILSGESRQDLALTVAPQMLSGSLSILMSLSAAPARRLLNLNEGKYVGVHAVFAACRIQVYVMEAELDEIFVKEQRPIAVLGIRRLLIGKTLRNELIVPGTTFLNVSVRVESEAIGNETIDMGFAALVLHRSPFSDSMPIFLISPVVCFSMFNTHKRFTSQPYSIYAKFFISLGDHQARKQIRADGSSFVERYICLHRKLLSILQQIEPFTGAWCSNT
jgi:hypothetical protein